MKVAPVSADLMIKVAIGAAAIGAAWYIVREAKGAFGNIGDGIGGMARDVFDSVGNVVQYVNPASEKNVFHQSVNAIGAAVAGVDRKSFSLGATVWEKINGLENPDIGRAVNYDYASYAPAYTSNAQWSNNVRNPFLSTAL